MSHAQITKVEMILSRRSKGVVNSVYSRKRIVEVFRHIELPGVVSESEANKVF